MDKNVDMGYKVTLAMPVYNVQKYIERALFSALNQTFASIEFLIIDDKGQDESMNIVHKIVAKHPRGKDVRIIDHGVNRGTGATKNTAINEAKGEYLFFMDSDDELMPECISKLYNKMQEERVNFVVGSYNLCNEKNEITDSLLLPNENLIGTHILAHYYYNEGKPFYMAIWNKLYNVDFLRKNKIHCFSTHINEDVLFTFQIAICSWCFSMMDDITYNYFVHEGTTMQIQLQKGLSIKTAEQYKEILEYKRKKIFDDMTFIEYGHLFVENYINDVYTISLRLMISSSLSRKQIKHYLGTYTNLSLFSKGKIKLKNKKMRMFYSLLRLSKSINYRYMVTKLIAYLVALKS